MRAELWLLVLVFREAARALSPPPGAGRTGRSWPGWARGSGALAGRQAGAWARPGRLAMSGTRGIVSAGGEEPCGLWQVDRDPTFLNTRGVCMSEGGGARH